MLLILSVALVAIAAGLSGFSIHGKNTVAPLITLRSKLFTSAMLELLAAAGSFQVSITFTLLAPAGMVIFTLLLLPVATEFSTYLFCSSIFTAAKAFILPNPNR